MTKPVAYIYEDHVFKTEKEAVLFKKDFDRYKHDNMLKHVILPLFIVDKISGIYKQNKRVEMTKDEFEDWKDLYSRFNELTFNVQKLLDNILDSIDVGRGIYIELAKRVYQDDDYMEISKKQIELINLFFNYSPDNPEETIEIVPNKKWFVRSKERNLEKNYYYFVGKRPADLWHRYGYKRAAKKFDTKEEAEKWTNPDTEAVHLQVEDE